jgi:dTMP kinase
LEEERMGEGKLIALEGIDDARLGAQSEYLCRWLQGQGIVVERTEEPTRGPVGALLRLSRRGRLELDPTSLALLWVADRMDHLEREDGILAWLGQGRYVLCARYTIHTYASMIDQVEPDWLRQIDALCRPPDLTLFFEPFPSPEGTDLASLGAGYERALEAAQRAGETIVRVAGSSATGHIERVCRRAVAGLF